MVVNKKKVRLLLAATVFQSLNGEKQQFVSSLDVLIHNNGNSNAFNQNEM